MRAFCALESPSQEEVLPGENPVGGMTHGRQGGRGGVCLLESYTVNTGEPARDVKEGGE